MVVKGSEGKIKHEKSTLFLMELKNKAVVTFTSPSIKRMGFVNVRMRVTVQILSYFHGSMIPTHLRLVCPGLGSKV